MSTRMLARGLSWLFAIGLFLLILPAHAPLPEPVVTGGQLGSGIVQVYVSGAVRKPGLYRLSVGSRVIQAIQLSGGLLPGTPVDQLSLTRVLVDGEQIHIAAKPAPVPVEPVFPQSSTRSAARPHSQRASGPSRGGVIALNQATIDQLDALPGIGHKRAADIVAYRRAHGSFRRLEDLRRIPGIGPKMLQRLRPHLKL